MADVTYLIIEGKTDSDEEIESFLNAVSTALKTQFAPRNITITISEPFPGDPMGMEQPPRSDLGNVGGYS